MIREIVLKFEFGNVTVEKSGKVEFFDPWAEIYWTSTVNEFQMEFAEVQLKALYKEYDDYSLMPPDIKMTDMLYIRRMVTKTWEMLK
ncbi:hypothetical protein FDI95_gp068 [Citrobacter phage CF1 ERZ-2017]|uniref:Uncharacterized protein n=1 Tax=Citrobacter phage CF1 ERZ-2017 TaxID=2267236 RepID=A0A2H4YFJ8_9CAUD|nr:hypothetical protein FDI95_gp068 [Citrobacter phage CF1 ERZ-2017]YP_010843942.1 hypothetical protein PP427_gp086 [Salmonella phage KM16]AUE22941.1 hypothetical protein Cf1_00068 [Citrobacter phage CF1 ERZ-2017]